MLKIFFCLVLSVSFALFPGALSAEHENDTFPPWFQFGVATAAYQIEGGWNEDGKGPSIWDTYTHLHRNMIVDHSTGDVACDSYHKFREDIKLCEYMGVDFYRFSISWARILPFGYSNYVNEAGIKFYDTIIDELIAKNITPMVTMYHWDLPQTLQNIGGWPNPLLIDLFADYARVLFERFGDRVKTWLTFNEPKQVCGLGYGTIYLAPGYVNQSGIADYMCGHTLLKAHAKVYHMYKDEYQYYQNATFKRKGEPGRPKTETTVELEEDVLNMIPEDPGVVAITIDTTWYEPASNSTADLEASFRKLMFSFGWFANPIFYKDGNYPEVMIDRIGNLSEAENFPRSRLPKFTPEEVEYIKGSAEFLGLNIYTSALVDPEQPNSQDNEISYFNDCGVNVWQPSNWPNTSDPWLKVTPWGARKLLDWIKSYYGDIPIVITENGYADKGQLKDYGRVTYYKEYLNAINQAMMEDKVNVKAYTAWALIDNFEWILGYTQKFGLNFVNFSDPNRPRAIKNSAKCYKRLIKTHNIDWDCTGDEED